MQLRIQRVQWIVSFLHLETTSNQSYFWRKDVRRRWNWWENLKISLLLNEDFFFDCFYDAHQHHHIYTTLHLYQGCGKGFCYHHQRHTRSFLLQLKLRMYFPWSKSLRLTWFYDKFDLAILAIGSKTSEEKVVEETKFCQNILIIFVYV